MVQPSFFIYKSSAGSGKTYTLVKEYLLLALRDPYNGYKHILAITFTNKAMQEMKSRMLEYLHDFSTGREHPMRDELIKTLEIDEKEFEKRCKILLEKILHEYSYFAISTIDAFFQRIIRSFAQELGLYGQFQLMLDKDIIKVKAIDTLISGLKENHDITEWIVRFAEEQIEEGNSWDIRRSLNDLSDELFKESFVQLQKDLPDIQHIRKLHKSLMEVTSKFKNQLISFRKHAEEILGQSGYTADDFKYNLAGPISFILRDSDYQLQGPSKRSLNGCNNINEWISKADLKNSALVNVVESKLIPLLNEAVEYYDNYFGNFISASESLKSIYALGLLSDISRNINDYKKDNDLLFIQDATVLISKLLEENDTPFIFEKVGSFFQHYLIDEFQDTSELQWRCLKPLVFDTVSSANRSIIVGDSKQSIYRWRGGDWSLLQHRVKSDMLPHDSQLENLQVNYRSGGNIINFNNELFKILPEKLFSTIDGNGNFNEETLLLLSETRKVFDEAEQQVPQDKIGTGYVQLTFPESEEEQHWKDKALDQVVEWVEDIKNRGFSLSDIALLVRTKAEASLLAQHLLQFTDNGSPKYPVLTNEALLLKNSAVISTIISTLRFIQNPKDVIAVSELIYGYNIISGNDTKGLHHILDENKKVITTALPFDIEKEKFYLRHLPMEEIIEHLIRIMGLPGNSGEEAYLQTFQDLVLKFGRAEGNDIESFLEWWDEQGVKESINIPSGLDAITIMTIHKAKGLQYPVIILPFSNWAVDSKNSNILWCSNEMDPYKEYVLPLKYTQKLQKSIFNDFYLQEKMQAALDSLNMLYVAFTRAEQELYAIAPDGKNGIGKFLRESLEDESASLNINWIPQTLTFESGEKVYYKKKEQRQNQQVQLEKYISHDWRNRLVVKKVGDGILNPEARRGTKMHHMLSRINYARDLNELTYFKSLEDEQLQRELRDIISHPQIKEYFTEDYQVLNEKSILYGREILRPDRVVIKGNTAIIIDYKWGIPQQRYMEQIRAYKEMLNKMGYFDCKGYLYYVDQKIVEKVS